MPHTPNAGAATDFLAGRSRIGADRQTLWFRLLLAAAFLPALVAIFVQGPEYDEAIMMLTVSGHTAPVWPDAPVTGADVQPMFRDRADAATLFADIRNTDVHPPLRYMTAWLAHLAAGPSLPAQRMMSLAALAACLVLLLGQWRRDAGGDARATTVFALLFLLCWRRPVSMPAAQRAAMRWCSCFSRPPMWRCGGLPMTAMPCPRSGGWPLPASSGLRPGLRC